MSNITCPNCGTEIPEDAVSCPGCGKDLKELEEMLLEKARAEAEEKRSAVASFRKERRRRERRRKQIAARKMFAMSAEYKRLWTEYVSKKDRKEKHLLEEILYEEFKRSGMNPPLPEHLRRT